MSECHVSSDDMPQSAQDHASPAPAHDSLPAPPARILRYPREQLEQVIELVKESCGRKLCSWQAAVTVCCNDGSDHIFLIAPCGSGKTLAFTATLFCNRNDVVIIICPLLALSDQHRHAFLNFGLAAIELRARSLQDKSLYKSVTDGEYRVLITAPEVASEDFWFKRLLRDTKFTTRLARVVFDEFHCIKEWSGFRPTYGNLNEVFARLPDHTKLFFASATCTNGTRNELMSKFRISESNTQLVRLQNECPNTFISVLPMPGPPHEFSILLRLLGDEPARLSADGPAPSKFLVFMPTKRSCEAVVSFMMSNIPLDARKRLFWLTADMSREFKTEVLDDLKSGRVWGGCVSECAGMGIDIPDISLVWQWGIDHLSFSSLYQRAGRAGRDRSLQPALVVFVEPKFKRYLLPTPDLSLHTPDALTERQPKQERRGEETVRRDAGTRSDNDNQLDVAMDEDESDEDSRSPLAQSAAAPVAQSMLPKQKRKKAPAADVDAAVLDFISYAPRASLKLARATASGSVGEVAAVKFCRRDVGRHEFDTAAVVAPQPESETCTRCVQQRPEFCCDLCLKRELEHRPQLNVPHLVEQVRGLESFVRDRSTKHRASVLKGRSTPAQEQQLRAKLVQWSERTVEAEFAGLDMAPQNLLSTEHLDKIVKLAHRTEHLTSGDAIAFHTGWTLARSYGDEIVSLIRTVFPPAAKLSGSVVQGDGEDDIRVRRCGACGGVGHRQDSAKKCRRHPDHAEHNPTYIDPTAPAEFESRPITLIPRKRVKREQNDENTPFEETQTPALRPAKRLRVNGEAEPKSSRPVLASISTQRCLNLSGPAPLPYPVPLDHFHPPAGPAPSAYPLPTHWHNMGLNTNHDS